MINQEHLDQWLHELRTTDIAQAKGTLVSLKVYGDPIDFSNVEGMCCLGIGEFRMGRGLTNISGHALPDRQFAQWLGAWMEGDTGGHGTIYVHWPTKLLPRDYYDEGGDVTMIEVATLNDNFDLTFPQIADVIEYFGLVAEDDVNDQ